MQDGQKSVLLLKSLEEIALCSTNDFFPLVLWKQAVVAFVSLYVTIKGPCDFSVVAVTDHRPFPNLASKIYRLELMSRNVASGRSLSKKKLSENA